MSLRRDAYWTAIDTLISSGLAFVLRLVVARILTPEDFGVASIAITIVTVLQVFNDFGLTSALIQRDEREVTSDFVNTTFTASLLITLVLTAVTALVFAPWAAVFYGEPQLHSLILILGLSLLPSPFITVSAAMLYRKHQFRDVMLVRVFSTFAGLATALLLLVVDPTPWVIVLQAVVSSIVTAIGMHSVLKWQYRLMLRTEFLKSVFSFSGLIFLNELIVIGSANAGVFVVGRALSLRDAGLFALAVYMTDTVRKVVSSILNRVTFVHYSKNKSDRSELRFTYLSTLRWNCRIIFPVMVVLALFAPAAAIQILGTEWTAMQPVIVWLAISVMIQCAGGGASNLFKAIGRPGLDLMLFVTTNLFLLIPGIIFGALYFGLEGVAIATASTKLISVVVRQIFLNHSVPGVSDGVVRTVVEMLLRQWPIVVAWGTLLLVAGDSSWMLAGTFAAMGGTIYAILELPRAFPGEMQGIKRFLYKKMNKL